MSNSFSRISRLKSTESGRRLQRLINLSLKKEQLKKELLKL